MKENNSLEFIKYINNNDIKLHTYIWSSQDETIIRPTKSLVNCFQSKQLKYYILQLLLLRLSLVER